MKSAPLISAFLLLTACNQSEPSEPVTTPDTGDSASGEPIAADATAPASSPAPTPKPGEPATSACADTEGALFSCKVRDGRTVAVCVQKDDQGREYAQYRFGKADQPPELAWPTSYSQDRMRWASVPYSGGGEAQLSFQRDDIEYVVYSRVVRTNFNAGEGNDPKFEAGVYVYRAGKQISDLRCTGEDEPSVSVGMAERLGVQQDDLFTD
ncbi:hypothetical protein [Pseudoblastomonas halimionae]|uniref:Lipoprotein n=1 Tax=Alteriqipengyuania halimionae TaxID=1926630 RepID=A0A6I4U1X5_9SPHN|nr:hypothetical protein [Alteriqipengyuania halimionae]MXP09908.1 hypothetical protein [Alteriqipengyuania halimionae]